MHSFLYSSLPAEAQALADPDTLHIHPDKSISIEQIRSIQHFLSRRPTQSDHNTVIIHQAHLMSLPAQNAILKILEEPPGNSQIYLVTPHPDSLIPTVLSRVQIISTPHASNSSYPSYIPEFLSSSIASRLSFLDSKITTRDSALQFLDQMEYFLHSQIQSKSHHLPPTTYHLIFDTRKYLKANCNVKLALDHLALTLKT